MSIYFCISVRFLQRFYHGRTDGGEPEWPPAPLRVFQSLVAAAANRWKPLQFRDYAVPALHWLEQLPLPTIVAASGAPAQSKYRLYVPDNVADRVAKSWSAGREASIADYRTEKDVRPTCLNGEAVHFLFAVPADGCPHLEVLSAAARSITHVGWGVDMVAAHAALLSESDADRLPGERWRPVEDSTGTPLRVPRPGTLNGLLMKHEAFLNRLGPDGFKPVPPLVDSAYRVVGYRRATDPAPRPYAAFAILKPDANGNRSFDTPRRARDIAAWLRHVTGEVCEGWPFEAHSPVKSFVHGHDATGDRLKGETADRRFMFLPLPTINSTLRRVESIRRVLVVAPPGCQEQINWVRRRLAGQDLTDEAGEVVGLLNLLPTTDWVLRQYVEPARVWSTVTPVILPGHDDPDGLRKKLASRPTADEQRNLLDRLDRRAAALLHRALLQAGLSPELVSAIEALDWRRTGFRAGVDLADRYLRPDKLNGRQYHVRIQFPQSVPGPLALGAGRYRGMGLFAAEH